MIAMITENPFPDFIGQFDKHISPDTCAGLIKLFEDAHMRKLTHKGKTGVRVSTKKKDSVDFSSTQITDVLRKKYDVIIKDFFTHLVAAHEQYMDIFDILRPPGTDPHHVFEFNIQRYYPKTQAYHAWHHEASSPPVTDRVLAWMTYLNTVEIGGETEFKYQQKKVQPEQGRTMIWPAGFTHAHRGLVAESEKKYIITGWFRFPQPQR